MTLILYHQKLIRPHIQIRNKKRTRQISLLSLSYIHLAVSDFLFVKIVDCNSAKKVWNKVKEEFKERKGKGGVSIKRQILFSLLWVRKSTALTTNQSRNCSSWNFSKLNQFSIKVSQLEDISAPESIDCD